VKVVLADIAVLLAELAQVLAHESQVQPPGSLQPYKPELFAQLSGVQPQIPRLWTEVSW
jgi:hypothetical protein